MVGITKALRDFPDIEMTFREPLFCPVQVYRVPDIPEAVPPRGQPPVEHPGMQFDDAADLVEGQAIVGQVVFQHLYEDIEQILRKRRCRLARFPDQVADSFPPLVEAIQRYLYGGPFGVKDDLVTTLCHRQLAGCRWATRQFYPSGTPSAAQVAPHNMQHCTQGILFNLRKG